MKTSECFRLLKERWADELVVCTLGTVTSEWYAQSPDDRAFHMHAMGIAASFALGLALARPSNTVWLLDSDGGLSLGLGTLLTEAQQQPPNLKHLVIDNGSYQIIGGYPVVNAGTTDFSAMARGAGIEHTYRFGDLGSFKDALGEILAPNRFTFSVLNVEAIPAPKVAIPFEGPEIKYRFARHMERQEGIHVLGPHGY